MPRQRLRVGGGRGEPGRRDQPTQRDGDIAVRGVCVLDLVIDKVKFNVLVDFSKEMIGGYAPIEAESGVEEFPLRTLLFSHHFNGLMVETILYYTGAETQSLGNSPVRIWNAIRSIILRAAKVFKNDRI